MSFLLAPVISEMLSSLGLLAGEALTEVGVSEAVSSAVGTAAVGYIAGEGASAIEEQVKNFIGPEKVSSFQKTFDDLLADSMAVLNKDEHYFINKSHDKGHINKPIDFKNEDPTKFNTGKVEHAHQVEKAKTVQTSIKKISSTEIANFVVNFASELTNQAVNGEKIDKIAAATKVLESMSNKELINSIGPFLKNKLPNSELYQKISSVYNGSGMSVKESITMYKDPRKNLLYFILKDETGKLSTLYQTTGIVLPAYPGTVFMGPRSPNNNYPTNLTDLFCAFHDQTYINGPNLEGDYSLISRCANRYNDMDDFEKKLARICIMYFGTLGTTISNLLGSSPSDIHKVPSTEIVTDDIYTAVSQEINPVERMEFYDQLYKEIDNFSRTGSVISQYSGNKTLANEFGSLLVGIY